MIKGLLNTIFPFVSIFRSIIESPIFCKHQMRYWDMKWYMDDPSTHKYDEFNGKIWKDAFCQCQKCGVKYRMDMRPKRWGNWIKSDFTPTKGTFIEVEIFQFGQESKKLKRDNKLNQLLK